ncbi:MAG TPA: hypothetical protein GXX53_01545 [Tissierellia bacterium]|nr:hypothetical protein [Tissierellia bacterium]
MRKDSLKNSINKAIGKKNGNRNYDFQMECRDDMDDNRPNDRKSGNKRQDKPLKTFGILCIAAFITMFALSGTPTVDTSDAARRALGERVSTLLPVGTILLSEDQNIGQEDYTITHQSDQDETRIWIWDYAAEDGDYVQVLVNGIPVTEPFMIKNRPKEIQVPATGDVQIKGIRDGGGGITYAVHYELNNTNYFNTAPEGEFNTYTLIRQ